MWPTVKSSHILDLQLRVATGKASHGSNQTLKVTTTTEGQKQQSHELRKGKIFGTYSFFFSVTNSPILKPVENEEHQLGAT